VHAVGFATYEAVTALGEELDQPVGEVAAGEVEAEDGVGERVALVDGDSVRDAVAGVHDDAGGAARRVEREDGLDGHVHGRHVEGLEHDLGHLLAVGLRVERGLGEEDRVLLGGDAKLRKQTRRRQVVSRRAQLRAGMQVAADRDRVGRRRRACG
jgi:hypothetical protein